MAERRARLSENRAHPATPIVVEERRDGEHPFLHRDKASGLDSPIDRQFIQPELIKLTARHPVELGSCKPRDVNVPHPLVK